MTKWAACVRFCAAAVAVALMVIPPEDLDPIACYVARYLGPAEPLIGK